MALSRRPGLLSWMKKDPVKAFIILTTCIIHSSFILAACLTPSLTKKKSKQKLIVKTIQQAPRPQVQTNKKVAAATPKVAAKTSTPAHKSPARPQAAPNQKKATAEKPVKPQTEIKKQGTKEKPATQEKVLAKSSATKKIDIPKELLEELEERIAKIETKRDKLPMKKADVNIPQKIEPSSTLSNSYSKYDLAQENDMHDESITSEYFVYYLQQQLHLPDFGEVKVQITLRADGTIEKCVVFKAESEKNKKYLEEKLPSLRFPDYKGQNGGRQTFVLTFCNEI
jgi:outer membrane biosynthesis protein TonB